MENVLTLGIFIIYFQIAINGTHFCQFNHRLPLNTARYLSINGDCAMITMILEQDPYSGGGGAVPPPYPMPIQALSTYEE